MSRPKFMLFLAAVTVASLAAFQAGSASYRAVPSPTVAVVQIAQVINELEERVARENELQVFISERDAIIDALKKRFEIAKSEFDLLPGGAERRSKAEDLERLSSQIRTETELAKLLVDRRRGEVFAALFTKIQPSVQELAQSRGYTLVLSDDQQAVLPASPSEQQARSAIYGRRVMFADDATDITAELVQLMNNQWKVGQAP